MDFDHQDLKISISKSTISDIPVNNDPFGLWGAERYDIDASCMSLRYQKAHAVQNDAVSRIANNFAKFTVAVDFGCGTASDGLDILSNNNNTFYVGIDSSKYMLKRASKKFNENNLSSRSLFLHNDFQAITSGDLLTNLRSRNINPKIQCVMSSLMLHHYCNDSRRAFYRLVLELLDEGGILILTDLFTNTINICNQIALDQEVSEVSESISRLGARGLSTVGDTTLSVDHYLNENSLDTTRAEFNLLTRAGFKSVDIVYRDAQLAVIVALKECQ